MSPPTPHRPQGLCAMAQSHQRQGRPESFHQPYSYACGDLPPSISMRTPYREWVTLDMHVRTGSLRNNCERSCPHAKPRHISASQGLTTLDLPPNSWARTMLRHDDPADAFGAGEGIHWMPIHKH